MPANDRANVQMTAAERWDAKYADWQEPGQPSDFVMGHAELLASCPTAVDLAGGTGGTALWLAAQGIDTTLVDVSGRALEIARNAAAQRGVPLCTVCADLETDPVPTLTRLAQLETDPGPTLTKLAQLAGTAVPEGGWHAAVCANFLHRPLLSALHALLAPGGVAFVLIATVDNLQRNARPGRPFLAERGELPDLCHGLEPISFEEAWFAQRHEARLIARRPA